MGLVTPLWPIVSMPEAVQLLIQMPGMVVQHKTNKTAYRFNGEHFYFLSQYTIGGWERLRPQSSLFDPQQFFEVTDFMKGNT